MTDRNAVANWIDATIHHHRAALLFGVLTIVVLFPPACHPPLLGLALVLGILIVPSQVCLIGLCASLSPAPLRVRLERAVLWSGSLYFIVLGAAAIHPQAVGSAFPVSLAIAMSLLLAGAGFAARMLRQYGWRLVQSPVELADLTAPQIASVQFHLADMLRWITTLCALLALGAATIPRFAYGYALHSYSPAAYALVDSLCGSVCVAGPLGAMSAGVLWLVLATEDFRAAFRLAARDPLTWIILLWSFLIAVVLSCPGGGGETVVFLVLIAAFGFAGPMAAGSFILRGMGYRLKLVRPPSQSDRPRPLDR